MKYIFLLCGFGLGVAAGSELADGDIVTAAGLLIACVAMYYAGFRK